MHCEHVPAKSQSKADTSRSAICRVVVELLTWENNANRSQKSAIRMAWSEHQIKVTRQMRSKQSLGPDRTRGYLTAEGEIVQTIQLQVADVAAHLE